MKNATYLTTIATLIVLLLLGCSNESDNSVPSSSTQDEALSSETETNASEATNNAFSGLISKSAEGAEVFFLEPQNGAKLSSPVTIKFGIKNMVVAKAGDQVENSGHHHLLVNLDELPQLDVPLPATDQIIHFGGAQTETSIDLPAGEHQLQLLLGNYLHIPHDKPVLSEKITITVQ